MRTMLRRRLAARLRKRTDPPRGYRLEEYKRWFPTTADLMCDWIDRAVDRLDTGAQRSEGRGEVALVVGPWVSTPVPWYAIALGLGLRDLGRPVVLLHDDTGFAEARLREQQEQIERVLARVAASLPTVRLSDLAPAPGRPGDEALIARLTDMNVTWRLRGGPVAPDEPLVEEIRDHLTRSLPQVRSALQRPELDLLVTPGGIYGASGLFLEAAKEAGARGATFDTDRRIAQICVDGVAARNDDLARAHHEIWHGEPAGRDRAIAVARREFTARREQRDSYGFQAVAGAVDDVEHERIVLIPMNVEWDSAALGRHHVFDDTAHWLVETIRTVLDHSEDPVVVRQHPSERRRLQRSDFDVAGLLGDRFGDEPRVRLVEAADPVNSYDLLSASHLVLPYVSTIATEAAAMGKPVVVAGDAYYRHLGFVRSADRREEYLDLVVRGLRGELDPMPDQVERAWTCFYLSAVQNRIDTHFTPHPDDFWSWSRTDPAALVAEPEVRRILEALDTGVPVSLLGHRDSMETP